MKQNTHCVYHLHTGTTTADGYVGVTSHLRGRLYSHRGKGLFQDNTHLSILLVGSEQECLDLERQLRPKPNMGWNVAEGGWNKFPKGFTGGHRSPKGVRFSIATEFKKGEEPHNAGATRYELIDPEGNTYIVDNLTRFCEEHSLTRENIRKVARGLRKHHKQWTAKIISTGR